MGANTQFKDSMFSSLFNDPESLRGLYSALIGIALPPDVPIEINTLDGILYMGQLNDISFTIGDRLVILIEHQSTINPNMPLRLLMYIGRIYEKMVERRNLYKKTLEKIPTPEFIVLYNGTQPYPDQKTLKLSDAFKDAADLRGAAPASPVLELEVKVYNINKGHNADIVAKCEKLQSYSFFVDKVREMGRDLPQEDAMKAAIDYCIKHGVLQDFLETHSSEVFNMLLTEWDTEEAKEVWFEEGVEAGLEQGIEVGLERGREEGWHALAQLLQEGKTITEAIAYLQGKNNGGRN